MDTGTESRLSAVVEVMTTDGRQIETQPPVGESTPGIHGWWDPSGEYHREPAICVEPAMTDGAWSVEVELTTQAMLRVDIQAARA